MNHPEATCKTCHFWQRIEGETSGECRCDRPAVLIDATEDQVFAIWPQTEEGEWCGRHPHRFN